MDDILLAGKSEQKIAHVKADLGKRFLLKDMGELHYFLGVSALRENMDWPTTVYSSCSQEVRYGEL